MLLLCQSVLEELLLTHLKQRRLPRCVPLQQVVVCATLMYDDLLKYTSEMGPCSLSFSLGILFLWEE